MKRWILLAMAAVQAAVGANPGVETFKQVLTEKLLNLKPNGMTERDVRFVEVQEGRGSAASFPFRVTALVRDYGPGYPRNRYYGETCVRRFDKQDFTLVSNGSGGWMVEGALTPPLATQVCKPNPGAGVSSIPLASLPGTAARAGAPPPSAPADSAGGTSGPRLGSYECWANGQARMLLNFSFRSGTQYVGSDGQPGSFAISRDTGRIVFKGGALDGVLPAGFYTMYIVSQGRPRVSFRNSSGNEVSYCEWAR